MKVIHTADWHLGQRLVGRDRTEEHQRFLRWLLQTIRKENVNLLIVAGDIFDSAHPPQATMQLYYDFLRDLSQIEGCGAVLVGGNHDSPAHLNAPRQLLKRFQIHVVGSPSNDPADDILQISPGYDLLDSVCVCAIPFLRDRDVQQVVVGEGAGQREERLREGVYQYFQDMRERAQSYRERGLPVIATGHLTMRGVSRGDGEDKERPIGTLSLLEDARMPQDFDYLALGHLHEAHAVGDRVWMRYSGSPFPMSFAEANHQKEVTLLDFRAGVLCSCRGLPIPQARRLYRFGGTLEGLESWLKTLKDEDSELTPWLEVHLTLTNEDGRVTERVHDMTEGRHLDVLKIITGEVQVEQTSWREDVVKALAEYRPEDVFVERCRSAGIDPESPEGIACRETFAELRALHEAKKLELVD